MCVIRPLIRVPTESAALSLPVCLTLECWGGISSDSLNLLVVGEFRYWIRAQLRANHRRIDILLYCKASPISGIKLCYEIQINKSNYASDR
ncbi:uncharacterized protein F4822DRAFT_32868 [Hypoxylon trugodes]|uniref:uncharacterized protein n=1 Tax=Hypoxylon trugodes TaxID=326681 RepID=UPI00219F305B|nr:uncharacterized protein F4822DRAFT_32868 [Hypoxylon trugodes]KAI1393979.1 hypothetical protein F4822DRAFT_32868 [Hypoxylon trugodes]